MGSLGPEPQRRNEVRAEVDREDLQDREGQRDREQREGDAGHDLWHVRRQDVGHEAPHVVEDRAALLNGVDDVGEIVLDEHHVGGFARHVAAAPPHRDADVRLADGRRVVDAVAGGGDHMALGLERAHDAELLVGPQAGEDCVGRIERQRELGVRQPAQPVAGHGHRLLARFNETDAPRERHRRLRVVAGSDDHPDARLCAPLPTAVGDAVPWRVLQADEPEQDEIVLVRWRRLVRSEAAVGKREHAQALGCEFLLPPAPRLPSNASADARVHSGNTVSGAPFV